MEGRCGRRNGRSGKVAIGNRVDWIGFRRIVGVACDDGNCENDKQGFIGSRG